jgi:hypothetical protein
MSVSSLATDASTVTSPGEITGAAPPRETRAIWPLCSCFLATHAVAAGAVWAHSYERHCLW